MLDEANFGVSWDAPAEPASPSLRPTRSEAEEAVRTLIRWAGDDPRREGLLETPARVARAYREWFSGYGENPDALLQRTFNEVGGYSEAVLLRDIPVESTCEHHMAAIRGRAHIAYLPNGRVVGISKLARLVDALSRRLQIQERLTSEIEAALERSLKPLGVAVVVGLVAWRAVSRAPSASSSPPATGPPTCCAPCRSSAGFPSDRRSS